MPTPVEHRDLRTARRDAGLSQEALARLAGCSTGYLRLLERGYRPAAGWVTQSLLAAIERHRAEAGER